MGVPEPSSHTMEFPPVPGIAVKDIVPGPQIRMEDGGVGGPIVFTTTVTGILVGLLHPEGEL